MGRTRQILLAVLKELGVPSEGDAQLEHLLSLLIQYWRAELLRRSGENQQLKDQHRLLIESLQAAVRRQPIPELPLEMQRVVNAVAICTPVIVNKNSKFANWSKI